MKVSNYDEYDYDYETYWNNRQYEDLAEKTFLKKAFSKLSGKWFIDIGGSYGRNTSLYHDRYERSIIVDYSLKTLQSRYDDISRRYPNTTLIAANAYKLPFKEASFDGGLMVRVLHHLDQSETYFKELSRIIAKGGSYIQEFANKIHLKSSVKHLLKKDFKFFNDEPFQQPNLGNFEGTKGEATTFLNYHPKDIVKKLSLNGFEVNKRQGVSYYRIPLVKRLVPLAMLGITERISQSVFRGLPITPSMFFVSKKITGKKNKDVGLQLEDILCCPRCKAELEISQEKAKCHTCESIFAKKSNIWDFRID